MAGNANAHGNGSSSGPTARGADTSRVFSKGVGRYGLDGAGRPDEAVSWEMVDPQCLWGAVCAVTKAGDALMLSVTSDGGAYSITVMSGGKSDKVWPKDHQAVQAVLTQIMERAG